MPRKKSEKIIESDFCDVPKILNRIYTYKPSQKIDPNIEVSFVTDKLKQLQEIIGSIKNYFHILTLRFRKNIIESFIIFGENSKKFIKLVIYPCYLNFYYCKSDEFFVSLQIESFWKILNNISISDHFMYFRVADNKKIEIRFSSKKTKQVTSFFIPKADINQKIVLNNIRTDIYDKIIIIPSFVITSVSKECKKLFDKVKISVYGNECLFHSSNDDQIFWNKKLIEDEKKTFFAFKKNMKKNVKITKECSLENFTLLNKVLGVTKTIWIYLSSSSLILRYNIPNLGNIMLMI